MLSEARTGEAFMASSVFGRFKEVVHLVPVKHLTGTELHKIIRKVLNLVSHCGLKVLAVISDNNRLNQNMFCCFTNECPG